MKQIVVGKWTATVLGAVVFAWECFKLATVFGIGILVFQMLGWI